MKIWLLTLWLTAIPWMPLGSFAVTRYCNCERCCGRKATGVTATGTRARYGVVAVDPGVVPLGSRLRIEGFDVEFRAEDTGRLIRGRRLDVWHWDHRYCRQWGRQARRVWIRIW